MYKKKILEFDDFVSNLSLSEVQQQEIKDFVKKYEKYMNFHDAGEFEASLDELVSDVMTHFNFPASKKEDVQNYIQSLQTLSDGISVIMSPGPEIIYRTNPDMTQTIVY
ncbi:hypothetical protein EBS02_04465 [bacterium]|jgi:hypothetical protein|nr:hypothetical protein [bacterium]